MDLIKQEIMKKRQALSADRPESGGKRFFKRSEIEQKRLQKVREEEKRELEEKSARQQQSSSSSAASTASLLDLIYSTKPNTDSSSKSATLTTDEQNNIDELKLSKQEVIRRLRLLKQPITLFGEDDDARLDRYKNVLKTGTFEVDSDVTEGQTNDFLRDIVELKKWQKTGIMSDRKRKSEDLEDGETGKGDEDLSGEGASSGVDADKDIKLMKAKFEDLCEEDKILVFFKKLLNEWRQELNEMQDLSRRTAKGKQTVATFKQCGRYLTPLFKFCRKRALPDDIKKSLMFVVDCCMQRDYRTAVDCYIKLAIGNAPWPIGVTMVGIHERSAREKIYTNSVAHIMNDETTRKYLQSVKRLVTFCQRKYPTVPSKSIEFNSLANGSDLQALLMDEQHLEEGNHVSEERLQLMPAPSDE
ncbi:pre-mRNA-splicing factor 18-like [Chenopodium quinoa]|uniref:pre-mRNA-splicing factor 18-like n=1 Tax=Chenopodium quinoa TaxID=63459 RepID=UPI000B7923A2|nr:pre-mRNA-splicing factor 18-like [Chenopodium quinoa]